MSRFTLRPIAASLLFISSAVVAAEPPIIVTATRTAQIADESLAPVIVIDRAQIEQSQATDVAELLRGHGVPTQTGQFGAHMLVEIDNDGPVTIWLEK